MSSWNTKDWLKSFGLEQYYNCFIENGYETRKLCANLKDEDLDGMDITNTIHRDIFLNQADMLRTGLDKPAASAGAESPSVSSTGSSSPKVGRDEGKEQSSGSRSPKRSNSIGHAAVSTVERLPVITDTSTYTAVFDDTDSRRPKKKKIRSPKVPKKTDAKSDHKPVKIHVPLPSNVRRTSEITALASVAPLLMTKLQLKLRIKDMLTRDHIVLSHAIYSTEEGIANELLLIELAEKYADELGLEGLNVYDAVKDVWCYQNNEKSEYVLPKSSPSTPSTATGAGSSFAGLYEQSNYSEPFDATPGPTKAPVKVFARKAPGEAGGKTTSPVTLPPVSSNYAEPFDAIPVNSQPLIVKTKSSPDKKNKTIQPYTKTKSSDESLSVEQRTSKTLPPQSSPNLSTRSSSSDDMLLPSQPDKSPQAKRQWKPFQRSDKLDQPSPSLRGKKKTSGSMEYLSNATGMLRDAPSRQSLPPTDDLTIINGLRRSISTNPALLYNECQDESSKKNINLSHESLNKRQPNLQQIPLEQEANDDPQDFKTASRIKGLTVAKRSNSDLELSNMLEVYVQGTEKPVRFQRYQSSDTVSEKPTVEQETIPIEAKDEKKKSLLRRLFQKKKDKKGKPEQFQSVSSEAERKDSDAFEQGTLTNSTSLPDITAAATIHSEYAEVFDVEPGSTPTTPPKLPVRNRPHSDKTTRRLIPSSPGSSSPCVTPVTHHKLMVKSDSTSSTEVIHSTPASVRDDIIEIQVATHLYDQPSNPLLVANHQLVPTAGNESIATPAQKANNEPKKEDALSQEATDQKFTTGDEATAPLSVDVTPTNESPQTNQYDNPWKPILRPKPKPRKPRVSLSDSSGISEEKEVAVTAERPHKPPLAPKPHRLSGRGTTPPSQTSSPSHSITDSTDPLTASPPHTVADSISGKGKSAPPKPSRSKARSTSPPSNVTEEEPLASGDLISFSEGTTLPDEHPVPLPRHTTSSPDIKDTSSLNCDKTDESETSKTDEQLLNHSDENQVKVSRPNSLPRPLKPSHGKPASLSTTLQEKLSNDGIDITSHPYSSQRGEYGIPSALVSRYAEETGHTEEEIAKVLDKIRRTCLLRARRGHIPLKKDWKRFSDIETTSIEEFLTSVGLPQCCSILVDNGYTSVSLLKGPDWKSLPLQESHKRRISAFAKKL